MENASKALIIAGAILLSILIIGLGIFIFQQAKDASGSNELSAYEVQQYNSKFLAYEGDNISGSQAMALCDLVKQHNLANQTDLSKQVEVTDKEAKDRNSDFGKREDPSNIKGNLRSGYTYKITFGYDSKTGYVTQIGIVKN